LQPITQDSIPPSAKRRVRRRPAEHEEYIRNHCGDVYRHDPAKEAPPDLPLYHSEFSKAESACLRIPNHWLDAIDAIKDPQLTAVLEPEITRMLKTYKSKPESVAVVGRIRQGKSRLIEALLGIDQIAKSVSKSSSK
jgi:predicted GTPase